MEGLRYVGLELVRHPKQSVRYILKYVAKGVQLDDTWLEALKRLKYVRSWGFLYNMKEPSYDMICVDSGGKCYPTTDTSGLYEYAPDTGELRIERLSRMETGPPS